MWQFMFFFFFTILKQNHVLDWFTSIKFAMIILKMCLVPELKFQPPPEVAKLQKFPRMASNVGKKFISSILNR